MYSFLKIFSICFICWNVCLADPKPNVLVILVDDLGYTDLSCYGGEIQTPHLDHLAANGLRYTAFYNTARCWPTRSAIMSGFYPQQIGRDKVLDIKGGGRGKRPVWAPLLPMYLKKLGYRSYHSGKWHIDGMPIQTGFDHSYYLKDQHRFFNPQTHHEDDEKLPAVKLDAGYYGTVEVTNKMIKYLKDHYNNHSGKPFFSYLAYAAPHFPLHALPEDIEKVGDRYKVGWDVIRRQRWQKLQEMNIVQGKLSKVERNVGPPYYFKEAYEILGDGEVDRPLLWRDLTEKQKKFQQDKMTVHAAMIERMDFEIGRVISQLKKMGVFENTLIIFLSDNGASAEIMVRGDGHSHDATAGSAESHLCLGPGWSTVANTPFKMHKTWVHEGGSCTPFIAHWPSGIAAKGELRREPSHVIDIVPTIMEMAGLDYSKKEPVAFPGKSLLKSFTKDQLATRTLWWAHDGHHAIRVGDWKLVRIMGESWELYNLGKDRTESDNLASKYPEKVVELEKSWLAQIQQFRKDRSK